MKRNKAKMVNGWALIRLTFVLAFGGGLERAEKWVMWGFVWKCGMVSVYLQKLEIVDALQRGL